jgi:3-oxoadipate enol-lactonase
LIGQSLGSLVVQHFQIKYPEKVVATVHAPGIQLKKFFGEWAKIFIPITMGMFKLFPEKKFYKSFGRHRAEKLEVQQYLSKAIEKTGKKLVMKITEDMIYDLIEDAPKPKQKPMLICYGDRDLFFIRNGCRAWHRQSPGSVCYSISKANHIANQDNPFMFNRKLKEFLKEVKT